MVINPKISLRPPRQSPNSLKQTKKNITITLTITLITSIIIVRSISIQQLTWRNNSLEIGDYRGTIKGVKWVANKNYIVEWGIKELLASLVEGEDCSDAGEEAVTKDWGGFDEVPELRVGVR